MTVGSGESELWESGLCQLFADRLGESGESCPTQGPCGSHWLRLMRYGTLPGPVSGHLCQDTKGHVNPGLCLCRQFFAFSVPWFLYLKRENKENCPKRVFITDPSWRSGLSKTPG